MGGWEGWGGMGPCLCHAFSQTEWAAGSVHMAELYDTSTSALLASVHLRHVKGSVVAFHEPDVVTGQTGSQFALSPCLKCSPPQRAAPEALRDLWHKASTVFKVEEESSQEVNPKISQASHGGGKQ